LARIVRGTGEVPDSAIAMIDGEGTLVGWTSTAQRLVGYAAGEVVGRPACLVLLFLQNLPGHDGKDLA
jgi:hypothetical protein